MMVVLAEVQLEAVAILGRVGAVGAAVLVHVRVRLHVTVEHRLVDARVVALVAAEGLRAEVIAQVVLQVVLVLRHKRTLRTLQDLVVLDVGAGVVPELNLRQTEHGQWWW